MSRSTTVTVTVFPGGSTVRKLNVHAAASCRGASDSSVDASGCVVSMAGKAAVQACTPGSRGAVSATAAA